jgi:deoxycytidylate deaminase
MYMTCDISCADCARGIISAGITKVVFRTSKKEWPEIWKQSAERSIQMFKESGVVVEYYD